MWLGNCKKSVDRRAQTPWLADIIGDREHYVMVSKLRWKPFWLATQLYPQNDHDWTGWQNGVNDDACAQPPSLRPIPFR